MLRFFLPLGITPMMFATTHSIVLATLARLPLPAANLAVYTVVQSVTNVIKAPCLASRQTTSALVHDRRTYHTVMTRLWITCALFMSGIATMGFTPAGEWTLRNVIGLKSPTEIALAATGLKLVIFLPFVETLRNSMQGIVINLRATGIIPVLTATRVIATVMFAFVVVQSQAVSGIVAAAIAWAAGIGLEGILIVAYLTYRFGSPGKAATRIDTPGSPRSESMETTANFIKFFAPLGVMMIVTACLPAVIQSGLARGVNPTETLAAFGVAWSVTTVLTGALQMLHHVPLAFLSGADDPRFHRVQRFCLGVGLTMSGLIHIVAWTPVGQWLFNSVLGTPAAISEIALKTCVPLAFFPFIASWRETYWGILMKEQRTSMIGGAKIANVSGVFAAIVLLFGPLQHAHPFHPAVAGALAFTLGETVEALIIWYYGRRRRSEIPPYSPARAEWSID